MNDVCVRMTSNIIAIIDIYTITPNILKIYKGCAEFKNIPEHLLVETFSIPRLLENCDDECYISHEIIEKDELYMKCKLCVAIYKEKVILDWFETQAQMNKTCPNCRNEWRSVQLYKNC